MNRDQEHLKLLSIFHYVVAGLAGLFALFPILHLVIGLAILSGAFESNEAPEARFVGSLFVIIAATWILVGLAFAALVAYSGRCLASRRRYTFCLVIGGVLCIFVPFGTVLGVFTIVVLVRESVKQLFQPGATC